MMEQEYDVVVDVLQKHADKLYKMTISNTEWGIMDHIRMEQIDEIKQAIAMWKARKSQPEDK